jgi:hypothetical protein
VNAGTNDLIGPVTINDNEVPVFTCSPNGIPVGSSITCSAKRIVSTVDVAFGSITNFAFAQAYNSLGLIVNSNFDTQTVAKASNTANTLFLAKTAIPATFTAAGNRITYFFDLINTGSNTLQTPAIVDSKIGAIACPVLVLASGAAVTCTGIYTITTQDVNVGFVTSSASASASNGMIQVISPNAIQTVALQSSTAGDALFVLKTASPATYSAVGDIVKYTYNVVNTGTTNLLPPLVVQDNEIPNVLCQFVLNFLPMTSVPCTASYAVTSADVAFGFLTNTGIRTYAHTQTHVTNTHPTHTQNTPNIITHTHTHPSPFQQHSHRCGGKWWKARFFQLGHI